MYFLIFNKLMSFGRAKVKYISRAFNFSTFRTFKRVLKSAYRHINMSVKGEEDREFQLYAETELRFEVAQNSEAYIILKSGCAECFGSELLCDKKYTFRPNSKASIYTWQGCKLVLNGPTTQATVANETPMIIYANVHAAIEQMRQNAEVDQKKGPTVLVTGPKDSGKSSLCRILVNYAVRQGRKPVFVDLDVGQGQISIPGTLGALIHSSQTDIEEIFKEQDVLVYHFGFKSPGHNMPLFNALTTRIATVMNSRIENNRNAFTSGIIINTCGWVKSHGYRSITHAALGFEVDVILVIGQERLFKQLRKDMPSFVKVVFIPKTIGVFERSPTERMQVRDRCVEEYFYGFKNQLHPHKFDISFSEVQIYRIDSVESNDSYFPSGTKYFDNQLCLVPVEIGYNLQHHVLSVSYASNPDDGDIIETNVAGFVCVTRVNMHQKSLTILSPHPPPLPQSILLFSEIIFKPGSHII